MRLSEQYDQELRRGALHDDAAQRAVLEAFERLLDELPRGAPRARRRWRWLSRRDVPRAPRGIYLWGSVGRGKTWLMDRFYAAVPGEAKERLHYHRFMRRVHDGLACHAGKANPLTLVARDMAARVRLLCLDEFNVTDIGDAMLVAGLLEALLCEGIVLVATSNVPPDRLYLSGIQRASFLPAIDLLNRHTRVIELAGRLDYRRRDTEQVYVFHCPHDAAVDALFAEQVQRLAGGPGEADGALRVMGRALRFRRRADGLIWFDFEALCGSARSQNDYIEIARTHHTVFLSAVPQMGDELADRVRRFVFLIDELYDRRVKLILSAEAPADSLYTGTRLAGEFERTASRLQEMQTPAYLGQAHRHDG